MAIEPLLQPLLLLGVELPPVHADAAALLAGQLNRQGPVLMRLIKPAAPETWFNRSLLPLELQGLASSPLTQASRPSPMKESANTRMNIASPG